MGSSGFGIGRLGNIPCQESIRARFTGMSPLAAFQNTAGNARERSLQLPGFCIQTHTGQIKDAFLADKRYIELADAVMWLATY